MAGQSPGVPGAPGNPTLPPFASLPICNLQTGAPTPMFYQFLRQLWGVAQALGYVASGSIRLVAGQALVASNNVSASVLIFVTAQDSGLAGGTPGAVRVASRIPGTSFILQSTSATDTSLVSWLMVAPPSAIPP